MHRLKSLAGVVAIAAGLAVLGCGDNKKAEAPKEFAPMPKQGPVGVAGPNGGGGAGKGGPAAPAAKID